MGSIRAGGGLLFGQVFVAEGFAGSPLLLWNLKSRADHLVGRNIMMDAMTFMPAYRKGIFLIKLVIVRVDGAKLMHILILTAVTLPAPKTAVVGAEPYEPDGDNSPDDTRSTDENAYKKQLIHIEGDKHHKAPKGEQNDKKQRN